MYKLLGNVRFVTSTTELLAALQSVKLNKAVPSCSASQRLPRCFICFALF
jgi:hypothetical protein